MLFTKDIHRRRGKSPFGWAVRAVLGLALVLGVALLGSGCSGINTSQSVSPLDFFLPGLLHLQNDPQRPPVPQTTNSLVAFASDGHPR